MKKEPKQTPSALENIIYDEVMKLTHQYFGSDAPKYISKFMKAHLKKDPKTVTIGDLIGLIDWIKVLASFLEEDKEVVEHYISDLRELLAMG
jgi:hypothetical protein